MNDSIIEVIHGPAVKIDFKCLSCIAGLSKNVFAEYPGVLSHSHAQLASHNLWQKGEDTDNQNSKFPVKWVLRVRYLPCVTVSKVYLTHYNILLWSLKIVILMPSCKYFLSSTLPVGSAFGAQVQWNTFHSFFNPLDNTFQTTFCKYTWRVHYVVGSHQEL